ncbi:MAG TPA: response regulator [Terriglobales bacterium]|nr:response regulator [Terriglobales bacterium]
MEDRPSRILILDTDESALIALEHRLEDAGFDTFTTWDAAEAVRQLNRQQFELLILGDHPPELSAAEILRYFRSQGRSVRCVVWKSGMVSDSDIERFESLGASGVVPRHDHSSLLEAVRQHSRLLVPEISIPGSQAATKADRVSGSPPGVKGEAELARTA